MQAKNAAKRGEYEKMCKWRRIAIIFNCIAFVLITTYYMYITSYECLVIAVRNY